MRSIIFLILLLSLLELRGQGAFSNSTNSTLQKVLEDYPQSFNGIRGDLLFDKHQNKDFKSLVSIPGAIRATITHVTAAGQQNASWNCLLFETNSFLEASGKFRNYYDEIRNSIIKIGGQKAYILNGAYSNPQETASSHLIAFQLLPATGELQKVKVELHLFFAESNWKIALIVHDHASGNLMVYRSGTR